MIKTLQALVNEPSSWFSNTVEYSGSGRAEFVSPRGWVEGDAVCTYDATGTALITIKITSFHNEDANGEDTDFQQVWLADGRQPLTVAGIMSLGENLNRCTNVTIETEHGIYSCTEVFSYSWQAIFSNKATFVPSKAKFEVSTSDVRDRRFCAMPLINFYAEFIDHSPSLSRHPLRIYPLRDEVQEFLSSSAPDEQKIAIRHDTMVRNLLIKFEHRSRPAFIEKLPTYDFQPSSESTHIRQPTSIMVVEQEVNADPFEPADLLSVLSVASGSEVGASWLETRDSQGKLLARFHHYFSQNAQLQGRYALSNVRHDRGLSRLLSLAPSSSHWGTPAIRVAMANLVAGCISNRDVSVMLFYVCAGLDVLFEYFNLKPVNAVGAHKFTDAELQGLNRVLLDARNGLLILARKASGERARSAFQSMADRIMQLPQKRSGSFGNRLTTLLSLPEFEYCDVEVVDRYLLRDEPDTARRWADIISLYRNRTAHGAHYPNDHEEAEEELTTVLLHLHDILLRVVLRMLNYDGLYCPTTLQPHSKERINWVQCDTDAQKLGYGRKW